MESLARYEEDILDEYPVPSIKRQIVEDIGKGILEAPEGTVDALLSPDKNRAVDALRSMGFTEEFARLVAYAPLSDCEYIKIDPSTYEEYFFSSVKPKLAPLVGRSNAQEKFFADLEENRFVHDNDCKEALEKALAKGKRERLADTLQYIGFSPKYALTIAYDPPCRDVHVVREGEELSEDILEGNHPILVSNCLAALTSALARVEEKPDKAKLLAKIMRHLGFSEEFLNRKFFYPSGRPRTTMRFISPRVVDSLQSEVLMGTDPVLLNSYIGKTLTLEGKYAVPVVRYQAGMSRGLYYGERVENICGLFYYDEPGSNFYLLAEKILIAPNKILAYIELGASIDDVVELFLKPWAVASFETYARKHAETYALVQEMLSGTSTGETTGVLSYNFSQFDYKLYAKEDKLDQPLCISARDAGYQLVILTSMTGKSRIVSEVLDVRTIQESFSSIVQYIPV